MAFLNIADTFLQKTKQRYKNTRGLTTKLNLNDMSTELKLRPPFEISESDVQERAYSSDIVMSRTDTYRPTGRLYRAKNAG